MQLVIPGLSGMPRTDVAGIARYEVAPGATLELHPLVPLPAELAPWGFDVVAAGVPRDRLRLIQVLEKHTELGWLVTIAASEIVDPATQAIAEYRLHVLYQFLELGGIAVVRAVEPATFERAMDVVRPLLPHGRPDFSGDGVPALALIWAGL